MRSFIALLFFLIPLVWSRMLNANYLSTKTFLLYLSSSLALLVLPETLNYRKISKPILILLSLIFIYYIGYSFFDFKISNIYFLFKMLSFVFIVLFVYSQDLKIESLFVKTNYAFLFMWLGIVSVTGYEIFNMRVLQDDIRTDVILSSFGNINMFSEFAILSLPLLFSWARFKDRISKFFKLIIFGLMCFFILYGRSRSAWLGLGIWLIFMALQGIKKSEWIALGISASFFLLSHFTANNAEKISKFVPEAFSERSSLYRGSFELLLDNPMGIPLGQFMNEIVPYLTNKPAPANEFAYFDQPHSEFLKWGIQFGWLMLALSLVFFGYLVYELIKNYRLEKHLEEKKQKGFYIETFIMLLPQMMFQFPFENPATILYLGFVFGLFLSSYQEISKISLKYMKYVFGVLAILGILNAFMFLSSIYLESNYPNSADIMNIVCKHYPVNFKACYWKNKDLLDLKNISAFRGEFSKDFKENPFYCDNLRLLPDYFNYAKDEKKTCEALLLYNLIYKKQTHFLPDTMSVCSRFTLPFEFKSPQQFNEDFKKWFAK